MSAQMKEYTAEAQKSAHRLMKEIIPLKDQRFVDGSKILTIVDRFGIQDLEAKIYFLRELHSIVRKLPLKIFSDDQSRFRLLAALQDALDTAIDEEEEEEE